MANILLAEDDAAMRQYIKLALEKAGHSVCACSDGLEALASLEETAEEFDLLVTDIVMPGIDGIELSQRATRVQASLKVLFITGFSAAILEAEEMQPAKSQIISKPFHLSDLVRQVEDVLKG